MRAVLHILEALALTALCMLLVELALTIHALRPKLEVTIANVDRTVIVAGTAASHLEKAAGVWEQASSAQAANVSAAVKLFSAFVARTDNSLNSAFLPALTAAIEHQDAALSENERQLKTNLAEMARATIDLEQTLVDANKAIGALPQVVADADADVRELKPMLEAATATSEDVRRVADKFAEQYTHAKNIWLAGAQWLLQRAWELRGAVGF